MCTYVLYQGELVDKDWLNAYLNKPENQRKFMEEEEARKKQQKREREQERRNKKKKSESDKQKAAEYFHKYRQEFPPDVMISDEQAQKLWERAYNAVENERQQQEYRKQQEEQQRLMAEREKQERERREREQQLARTLPERILQMFLSGQRNKWSCCRGLQRAELYGHAKNCDTYTAIDIEPGLRLLQQEYNAGRLIRLDEQTSNRLVEFAKLDETYPDLINRLLDIAAKTAVTAETNDLK